MRLRDARKCQALCSECGEDGPNVALRKCPCALTHYEPQERLLCDECFQILASILQEL
jgi:hypothetical protein